MLLCCLLITLAPPEAWLFFCLSTLISVATYYAAHPTAPRPWSKGSWARAAIARTLDSAGGTPRNSAYHSVSKAEEVPADAAELENAHGVEQGLSAGVEMPPIGSRAKGAKRGGGGGAIAPTSQPRRGGRAGVGSAAASPKGGVGGAGVGLPGWDRRGGGGSGSDAPYDPPHYEMATDGPVGNHYSENITPAQSPRADTEMETPATNAPLLARRPKA